MQNESGNRGFRVHHEGVGELYLHVALGLQQAEKFFLVGQVRARRVAERIPPAAVMDLVQRPAGPGFREAPILPYPVVQGLCERLGHAQGQRGHYIGPEIIALFALAPGEIRHALAAGNGQQGGVILLLAVTREKIRYAEPLGVGLAGELYGFQGLAVRAVQKQAVAVRVRPEEPVDAARFDEPFAHDVVYYAVHDLLCLFGLGTVRFFQLQEAQVEQVLIDIGQQLLKIVIAEEMPLEVFRRGDLVRPPLVGGRRTGNRGQQI